MLKSINTVNQDRLLEIITLRKPLGLFIAPCKSGYDAVDNLTGDAWTEHFKTKNQCIKYLKGELYG